MEIKNKYFFLGGSAVLGFVIILPILFIIRNSFNIEYSEIANFIDFKLLTYLTNTLKLTFYTCMFSIILGVFPAFIISMYAIKLKKLYDILFILPLAIPCYIMSFIYADFFGYQGPFLSFLNKLSNQNIKFDILNLECLAFFFALSLYPYVYATSRIVFNLIGSNYLDLSQSLGVSKFATLSRVIIPLSFSGVFSGLLLIIMEVFNEYGAVNYFGIETFSNGIFSYWFSLDNKSLAIFLSLVLIVLISILLIFNYFMKKSNLKLSFNSKLSMNNNFMGKPHLMLYVILLIPILLGFVLPLVLLVQNTLDNIHNYHFDDILNLLQNTIFLGLLSSLVIVTIAFYILNVQRSFKSRFNSIIPQILTTGYAIPGAIIGLSIMLGLKYMGDSYSVLIGTVFILIYAYIFRFISVAIFSVKSSLDRQPDMLDDQAKSLELGFFKRLIKLHLPINKYAIIYAFILVFVDVVKELPITLILRPFNFNTLATQTYQYATEEMLAYSSIYSLTLIIVCTLLLVFSQLILNKEYVFRS